MSKKDNLIIKNLQMLGLDMIKEAGSGDVGLTMDSARVFYTLFMKHLNFEPHKPNFINQDRLLVSSHFLPLYYASLYLFQKNLTIENLKDYKKFSSVTPGYSSSITPSVLVGNSAFGGEIGEAVGTSLGQRYIEALIKKEDKKNELINFKTYVICTMQDLMSGTAYEALSYAAASDLKDLIILVINDGISKDSGTKTVFNEELTDRFISLNFDIDTINDNLSSLDGAIDDARHSKKSCVIVINTTYGQDTSREDTNLYYNEPLDDEEMASLRKEYGLNAPFMVLEEVKMEIKEALNKRLGRYLKRWYELKEESLEDAKIKEIIDFLETRKTKLSFKADNIKINDNYDEELILSNSKILNILASKSPFVLCGSNDNFVYTKANINKSSIMSKDNPTGRNILFGSRTLAMGSISLGLASLGFKVFLSAPLVDEAYLKPFIKLATLNSLAINYIFTNDTFLDTYEGNGFSAYDEISNLRSIPNLINFRPADINEILGVYETLSNYHKTSTIIISSNKVKKLNGTNPKYVLAGAYRVRKEREDANAIIITSGSEVPFALRLASELAPYGLDMRVISMPSAELFALQNEKYKNMLLPHQVKTFTLEFSSTDFFNKYATSPEYVLGLTKYSEGGSKEELLNYHNLDLDYLKTKILTLMKS